jgi:hypothetical protein
MAQGARLASKQLWKRRAKAPKRGGARKRKVRR